MKKRIIASVMVLCAIVGGSVSVAQAAQNRGLELAEQVFDSANPEDTYQHLNAADKAAFDAATTPSDEVDITVEIVNDAGGSVGTKAPSLRAAAATVGTDIN